MTIDFHAHCFPDRICEKAMQQLIKNSGIVNPFTNGTISDTRRHMKEHNVDKAVICNIATNAKQQTNVNNFAIENNSDDIIMFGSVFPFAEDAIEELHRIKSSGLKGIKLHPDYQDFFVDDERLFPIYETVGKLDLITVFHAGQDSGIPEPVHATPDRMKNILPLFSGAPVVAAHFGGWLQWYDVEKYLVGENIYFDTSYCMGRIPKFQAERMIKNHGSEKILFGSDLPWSSCEYERGFIECMELEEHEKENIFCNNAKRLLGI